MRFTDITFDPTTGKFQGLDAEAFGPQTGTPVRFGARFDLFLIREALHRGCDFEDLADGYGEGMGTHGDWSGIRDSSHLAQEAMFERALNFFFGAK